MNAIKLNWPRLTVREHQLIINELKTQSDYVYKIVKSESNKLTIAAIENDVKKSGYYHLHNWPNQNCFLQELFQNYNVTSKYFKNITIQKSINELPPHTDVNRKFTIINVVCGIADTVFYNYKFGESLKKIFLKEDLFEIERYKFEPYTWYAFCNSTIHGVENYFGERISLTFDLTDIGTFENYKDFIDNIYKKEILFKI